MAAFRLLVLASILTVTAALQSAPTARAFPGRFGARRNELSAAPVSTGSNLALRGGGSVDKDLYVKVVCAAFGMYALQMLFIPSKIVLDHFDTSFTPMIEFWVRGSAVGFMIAIAAILKLPTSDAHPLALLYSVACGVLYPWNAKFGYLTSGLPVKYPMHYVPELLMLGLTVAGVLAY